MTLGPENLGPYPFGADAETVIADLVTILGTPDRDTGWVPPVDDEGNQVYGPCPGTEIRLVEWENLTTLYGNGASAWAPDGIYHFFFYSYVLLDTDHLGFHTDAGVGLGSTVADLQAAYGDAVAISDDEFGSHWSVAVPSPGALWGFLTSIEPDGTVVSIQGGVGCGE